MPRKVVATSRIMATVTFISMLLVLTGFDTGLAEDFARTSNPTVNEGQTVILYSADAGALAYTWTQLVGAGDPVVSLTNPNTITATFDAPAITTPMSALDFQLVTINELEQPVTDTVQVTVFDTGISHAFLPPATALGASLITGDMTSFDVTSTLPITGTITPTPADVHLDAWFSSTIDLSGTGCVVTSPGSFTTTMTLFLPSRVPPLYRVARVSNGGRLYPLNAVFNSDRTQVSYVLEDDNVENDDDPTRCIIEDPVGIVLMPGQLLSGLDDDDGGCGCFISRTDQAGSQGNGAHYLIAALIYGSMILLPFYLLRALLLALIGGKQDKTPSP